MQSGVGEPGLGCWTKVGLNLGAKLTWDNSEYASISISKVRKDGEGAYEHWAGGADSEDKEVNAGGCVSAQCEKTKWNEYGWAVANSYHQVLPG